MKKRRKYALSYTIFATIAGAFTKYFGIVLIKEVPSDTPINGCAKTLGWEMRLLPSMKFGLKRGVALVNTTQLRGFKRRARNHQIAIYES